jgi:predicted acylesterase/phospholipase RssA
MKRALITSGGGAKGAFSVGALKALHQRNMADFDIVSGTSTGSLIAALAAVGKYDVLEREYTAGSNRDFLQQTNLVRNLAEKDKPYIFSTLPLEAKIREHITPAVYQQIMDSGKVVCLSSVSLQTGRRTVFTTKMYPNPNPGYDLRLIQDYQMFLDAILGSTNQAAFLPPVSINVNGVSQQFVDGGNRDVLPTQPAVDQHPDEIFALSNNPLELFQTSEPFTNVFDVLLRAISIFIQDIRTNDYAVLKNYTGGKVYTIEPKTELDRNNPTGLNFNQIDMIGWMRLGELAANRVLRDQGAVIV